MACDDTGWSARAGPAAVKSATAGKTTLSSRRTIPPAER